MKSLCRPFFPLLLLCAVLAAEQVPQADTESTVAELVAFHEIIHPIWHTAYPAKDAAALRGFLTKVNEGFAKIEQAKLPGILRDKQSAWDKGLAEFKAAVAAYNQAAAGSDDAALLDAAEGLHARFEMMVRIIRPVNKEVDAFHKLLYVVFHKHLPDRQWQQIGAMSGDMVAKAEAVTTAVLSKRLEAKTEAFRRAGAALLDESRKLASACQEGDAAAIEKAVNDLHSAYVALERVFD